MSIMPDAKVPIALGKTMKRGYGINEIMPPIFVLILSWGVSSISGDLGFVKFVTGVVTAEFLCF